MCVPACTLSGYADLLERAESRGFLSDAFQQHIGLSAPPPRMAAVHSSTADLDVMMTGSEGSDGAATTATTAAPERKGLGGTIINEGGCAMAPGQRSFGHIIMTR